MGTLAYKHRLGLVFGIVTLVSSGLHAEPLADRTVSDAVRATSDATVTHVTFPECNGWGGKAVARTELFFGLARPDGATISMQEFESFLDREVTPRFPAGLTLIGGNGQFRDASGITIRESSKLLVLLYPYNRENSRAIDSIRAAYAKRFQQESVLRVDGNSCVSF
jgi:Protein of unknown function (DUF3574)